MNRVEREERSLRRSWIRETPRRHAHRSERRREQEARAAGHTRVAEGGELQVEHHCMGFVAQTARNTRNRFVTPLNFQLTSAVTPSMSRGAPASVSSAYKSTSRTSRTSGFAASFETMWRPNSFKLLRPGGKAETKPTRRPFEVSIFDSGRLC